MPRKKVSTVIEKFDDPIKEIQRAVEQEEIPYVYNSYHSAVTLLHPSGDDYRSLTWQGYEYKALDMDPDELKSWTRSARLRDKFRDGTFSLVREEDVPKKVELPPDLRIEDLHYQETLKQIVIGHDEKLSLDIVNLSTAPVTKNKVIYLKTEHMPVLRAALYLEERQKKRAWMIAALKENIKRIEQMPAVG